MKAAVYLRVSTEDQSTNNQRRAVLQYAKQHGYSKVDVYSEQESAWKAGHQAELGRLLSGLRDGRRYDACLVWSLDRLSRQGAAAILNLVNTFKGYSCRVISLQEPWTELPGDLGEVLFAIAGWVARMESQRRSERTRAGLARLKSEGKKLGRPVGSRDSKQRRKKRPVVYRYKPAGVEAVAQ